MVKIVTTIIRGEEKQPKAVYLPKYLDNKVINQPVAAMYLVSQELEHLAEFAENLLVQLKDALNEGKDSASYIQFKEELETVTHLQEKVTEYITKLFSSGNLTEQQSEQTAGLLYVTNNIQRIAERCQDIDKIWNQIENNGMNLSSVASEELTSCISITLELLKQAI